MPSSTAGSFVSPQCVKIEVSVKVTRAPVMLALPKEIGGVRMLSPRATSSVTPMVY
jgi:hypothetical protein